MKLDELECFLEVARQRNMTAAAKVLELAQSTVSDRIHRRQLAALPMVFVGQASRHEKPEYSLRELAGEGFITFQPRSTPEQALQELLRAESLEGCRVDTVSSVAIMLRLVEAGAGIATLPRLLVERAKHSQLRVLPCRSELAPLPLWLSWRARRAGSPVSDITTSLLAFLEGARAFAAPASTPSSVSRSRVR